MSLSEQYEAVFGGSADPSRQKLKDVPYFVRIVTRKRRQITGASKCSSDASQSVSGAPSANKPGSSTMSGTVACIYCSRVQCKGCPLKFEDKITLKQVLDKAGVTSQPHFFYEENR